jgi:ABC-type branched-subunit amino acid transport system substrate-binding protein
VKGVPIISPGATSVEYTDKTPFPFLLRTVGSDKLQFDAFSQLARLFGWKRMAVVSQQTAYGVAQVNELKASLEDGGVVLWAQFMVAVGKEVERANAVDRLAQSGCRVAVGIMQSEEWQPLLDTARRRGMTEKYVWLATNTAEGVLVGDGLIYTSRYCIGHCGIHKGTVWQGRTVGDRLSALPGSRSRLPA